MIPWDVEETSRLAEGWGRRSRDADEEEEEEEEEQEAELWRWSWQSSIYILKSNTTQWFKNEWNTPDWLIRRLSLHSKNVCECKQFLEYLWYCVRMKETDLGNIAFLFFFSLSFFFFYRCFYLGEMPPWTLLTLY